MKRFEIYIIEHVSKEDEICKLRFETDSIDEACDKAHEIENTSTEKFNATAIYDNETQKWFGYHERGTSYIISK